MCCTPSGAALFVLGTFQQFSMGLEPSCSSWVQRNSFTLCLMMGTRLFIPQGSLAAHPRSRQILWGEKSPKTQDKDVFLLPASQKLLEWAAHTSTRVFTHVQPHRA